MVATDWIEKLTVAKLKVELQQRGQAVSGKKTELVARLAAYVVEHEASPAAQTSDVAEPAAPEVGGGEAQAEPMEQDQPAQEAAATVAAEEPAAIPATMDVDEPAAEPAKPSKAKTPKAKTPKGKGKPTPPAKVAQPAAEVAPEAEAAPAAEAAPEAEAGAAPATKAAPAAKAAQAKAAPPAKVAQAKAAPAAKVAQAKAAPKGKPLPKEQAPRIGGALTMTEISRDRLTKLAEENWSTAARSAEGGAPAFKPELVEEVYRSELGGASDQPPALRRVMLLELSQYLENYLWAHFDASTSTTSHVMSILVMVNEKFRDGIPAWTCFMQHHPEAFPAFFQRVLALRAEAPEMRSHTRVALLVFMINAFQSLENEAVRAQVLRLVSLPLWHALSRGRMQLELHDQQQLAKHWRHLAKKEAKAAQQEGHVPVEKRPEATFLPGLLDEFVATLEAVVPQEGSAEPNKQSLLYCERFVEFLTDLLSQLPTRRFVHAVLEDRAILIKCYMSSLYSHPRGKLFVQLVDLLRFYLSFPIHDHTGDPLTEEDVTATHYERVQQLQRLIFRHLPKLRELALANCGTVEKRDVLRKALEGLTPDELRFLVTRQLRLVSEDDPWAEDATFLAEVMLATYERRKPHAEVVNEMPLYPTEAVLFDENQVPSVHFTGDGVLALPKLNLQFLTFSDYLLRNFHLFRLEATYEVREDILDVLKRVKPYLGDSDQVGFGGWARMAHTTTKFAITEVRKPKVGENKPAAVTADITMDWRGMRPEMQREWDELKQHDVLFLLTLRPPDGVTASQIKADGSIASAVAQFGLQYVRGCEVIEVRDEEGTLMNDFTGRVRPDEWKPPKGTVRTVTVAMDTAQYQMDMNQMAKDQGDDVYGTFNMLMRRKAKENNFKAVLESIRDLMNEDCIVPDWLHDILLGYGDPGAAQYANQEGTLQTVDFLDTFLDADHVREAFPDHDIKFVNNSKSGELQRPFRVSFPPFKPEEPSKGKRKADEEEAGAAPPPRPALTVEAYTPLDPGPYPQDLPPQNPVRFTPVQTSAVLSGVQPGLTMVVGPPGTGKTDTAVQIMHILYHNCPTQRTLLVTHSNQALNDLFTKIMERDVPSRYLLRLGMGEAELETDLEFSRVGRVNAMLARRLELLAEVERLAKLLKVAENVAYTCETAAHFWLLHVLSRWERFLAQAKAAGTPASVGDLFPFKEYFADAPQPLFAARGYEEDMEKAQGCFRHLRTMFQELEEIRPFELLRTQADRVNYLMTKQAKIVAMTCTHAALKRKEFLELGFKYDNLLMEESAQVLEIETFIPMLLQSHEREGSRLKRVVLIGDHHQLPPVVKNMALQKYSHLDQSMFGRFIRLGTPYIELNAQGRARPSLARLYNWRYRALGDLPAVSQRPEFVAANPGFAHDFQMVDVPDYLGRGESEPVPFFYQNLGEAEYLVSVFQYMRLLGYPAHKISVLTTYNGQKALIRDVIERRCAGDRRFGRPALVTTVDKYQGQQNDYVLLSLVRTRHFGHLRDVRRLVVAMSRSRLGLYVFGRAALFGNCYELQPTFSQLLSRPTKLALLPNERYGLCDRPATQVPAALMVENVEHIASIAAQVAAEVYAAATAAAAGATGVIELAATQGAEPAGCAAPAADAAELAGAAGDQAMADATPAEAAQANGD